MGGERPANRWVPRWGLAVLAGLLLTGAGCRRKDPPRRQAKPITFLEQVRTRLRITDVLPLEAAIQQAPDDAATRRRLADACRNSQDPLGVVLALAPIPSGERTSDDLQQYLSACLALGWLEQAATALKQAEEYAPAQQVWLAQAMLGHGRETDAAAILMAMEKPGAEVSAEEWELGARVWLRAGRPEAAARWARRAVELRRGIEGPVQALAEALLAAGRPDEALAALPPEGSLGLSALRFLCEPASSRPETARGRRQRFKDIAADGPREPRVQFAVAEEACAMQEWEVAAPLLEQLASRGYEPLLVHRLRAACLRGLGRKADAAHSEGQAAMLLGRLAEAEAALRRAVAANAGFVPARLDLARTLSSQGRLADALKALETAPPPATADMELVRLRASVLGRMERVKEQMAVLREAAARSPDRASEPLGDLGKVLYASQQFTEASEVLQRAVALEPSDQFSHLYLGLTRLRLATTEADREAAVIHLLEATTITYFYPWMNAGSALQALGHDSEAAACYRRAVGAESRWENPLASLAALLQKQGRLTERTLVLQEFSRARKLEAERLRLENAAGARPRDAAARAALGERLLRDGLVSEAMGEFLLAYGARPTDGAIRSRLALCCRWRGFPEMARRAAAGTL